jgi:hypothetical protein
MSLIPDYALFPRTASSMRGQPRGPPILIDVRRQAITASYRARLRSMLIKQRVFNATCYRATGLTADTYMTVIRHDGK